MLKTFALPHVTLLEKFRRVFAAGSSNTWDTEQSLFDSLSGAFSGNDKTRIGTAFHHLIEHGRPDAYTSTNGTGMPLRHFHRAKNFLFTPEQAEVAYTYKREHAQMACEVPVSKTYDAGRVQFAIRGRIDGLEGTVIRDAKTRFRAMDSQEYLDSYQWRFYLDMLQLKTFYYDVFEVQGFPTKGFQNPSNQNPVAIDCLKFLPAEEISCFAYPGMTRDLTELLEAFADWMEARKLWNLLKPLQPA